LVNSEFSGNTANLSGNLSANYLFGNGTYLQGLSPISLQGLTVSQSNITGGNLTNTISNVTGLFFDTDTGFNVTDLANGNVVVSLGSTFKTWEVNGQPSLVAVGEDTVEFIAGNGIIITTDPNSNPQSITFESTGGGGGASISNGNSNVNIASTDGNITFAANGVANIMTVAETGVYIPNTSGGATNIQLGDPTQGNLISNAVTLSNSSSVSNAIAQLNNILGKLVPPSPTNFPGGQTLSISSLSTYRMANFTQTDNTPGANKNVAGGTTVTTVRRAGSYSTSNIANVGPGDQGTITVFLNGSDAGNRTLTTALNGNGTYSNLIIFNNYDYSVANANITAGFWSVFSSRASGTVTEGWNEVKIADSATSNTNIPYWYYDSSAPGTPAFSNVSFTAPGSPTYLYSSTVPHYPNTNQFIANFEVNRLSGNMYPTSDTFITGTAGGAFSAPSSVTYASAGVTTPLAQNLYVSSGTQAVSTTANVTSGFGASSGSPSVTANNSYNAGTQSLSPGANVLYKTGTSSTMEETNIVITGTVGIGSGLAFRINNPGSTDTPTFSANATAFNSQTGPLQTYDATIVAAILKHDITNYSTGYLPIGPNLSSGRGGSQYFTFKFVRTSLSKFDFKWTGTLAGLWIALPGSVIDSTSTLNGWLDLSIAYAGAGIPGANTGAGGNGSNGCALGGVAPLNSAQTNKAITATLGTVSSSSTVTNELYVRIKLTSGQSITAFSLTAASN